MLNEHKDKWEQEHKNQSTFTVMHTMKPSHPLPGFVDFLRNNGAIPDTTTILDIGCGKGRNSIYLASLGFNVIGTDISEKAISDARLRSRMYSGKIQYEMVDLTEEWPHGADSIDAIIDCTCTIYIPDPLRPAAIKEAYRVLKPGGYYFFYGFASLPDETSLPNSASIHDFSERAYTHDELIATFSEFKQVEVKTIVRSDNVMGSDIQHTMWAAVFQK